MRCKNGIKKKKNFNESVVNMYEKHLCYLQSIDFIGNYLNRCESKELSNLKNL
jgi:hypothetical protein